MKHFTHWFTRLEELAARAGGALQWLSPTLTRFAVGTLFFQSGWGKLNNLAGVSEYFASLGLPAPAFQALLAASAEFACGGLLLLGFATRLAVVPLIVTMLVAIRTALWDQVDGVTSLFGIAEFLYILLLAWLATHGAGPLSVDGLVRRSREATGLEAYNDRRHALERVNEKRAA